jgi:hypothetical protein
MMVMVMEMVKVMLMVMIIRRCSCWAGERISVASFTQKLRPPKA